MKPLALSVLRELSDGYFNSIEKLARSFNANHSCIENALKVIERYGIILEKSHDNKYKWQNPIVWINEKEITRYLQNNKQIFDFVLLDSVDSTNRFLLDHAKSLSNIDIQHKIPVITTEIQTKGRGRLGRKWFSGLGDSLTFSLLWRFDCSIRQLSGLSLAVGVAIVRALKNSGINELSLKWPNDLLCSSRKLAGILIELSNDIRDGTFVVIGIGLNVQLSPLTKSRIDQAFIDLYSITGQAVNRNMLLALLLTELVIVLNEFNYFGFNYFKKEWISYHAYEGQLVSITFPDGSIKEGVSDGVESDGSIRLKLTTGKTSSFSSGELTV